MFSVFCTESLWDPASSYSMAWWTVRTLMTPAYFFKSMIVFQSRMFVFFIALSPEVRFSWVVKIPIAFLLEFSQIQRVTDWEIWRWKCNFFNFESFLICYHTRRSFLLINQLLKQLLNFIPIIFGFHLQFSILSFQKIISFLVIKHGLLQSRDLKFELSFNLFKYFNFFSQWLIFHAKLFNLFS